MLRRHWPWLFFGCIILVIFYPVLLRGAVVGGHHDRTDMILPFYGLYAQALRRGVIPQWNPYVFCGKSTMGSGMFVLFHPLYWLALASPLTNVARSTSFVLIAHVAIALAGSYLLFRRLGADRVWGTLATFAYVFSGSMALQMATELNFATFAYLPLQLWLVAGQRRGRLLANTIAQASVYALMLLSGMVQLVLYGVGVAIAFAVYRSVVRRAGQWRVEWTRLGASAAALALATAIASVRWIPFFSAQGVEGPAPIAYPAFESASHMAFTHLVRFVLPEFFGTDAYENFFGPVNHFESFGGYPGILAAWIMLHTLATSWNRRTLFWNLLFITIVLVCLGTPLTRLHYYATGRGLLHYSRVAWLIPLPCAAVVALQGRTVFRTLSRRTFVSIGVFVVGWLALAAAAYRALPGAAPIILQDTVVESVGQFVIVALALAMLMVLWRRHRNRSPWLRGALVALASLDLLIAFGAEANMSNPFFIDPSRLAYPAVDLEAARLLSGPKVYRVYSLPHTFFSRSWTTFTLNDRWLDLDAYSSSGYDNGVPRRIVLLYTGGHPPNRIFQRIVLPQGAQISRVTSTALIVDHEGLHRVDDPLPRIALFGAYSVEDGAKARAELADADFNPHAKLLVSEAVGFPSSDTPARGAVEFARDDLNVVELNVHSEMPALVLLNDTFDPGWSLKVDGRPAHPLRANYAFRAAEVTAGDHVVTWTYEQSGFRTGIMASFGGLAGLLALTSLALLQRRAAAAPQMNDAPSGV